MASRSRVRPGKPWLQWCWLPGITTVSGPQPSNETPGERPLRAHHHRPGRRDLGHQHGPGRAGQRRLRERLHDTEPRWVGKPSTPGCRRTCPHKARSPTGYRYATDYPYSPDLPDSLAYADVRVIVPKLHHKAFTANCRKSLHNRGVGGQPVKFVIVQPRGGRPKWGEAVDNTRLAYALQSLGTEASTVH